MENMALFDPFVIVGYQIQGESETYLSLMDKTYNFFKDDYNVLYGDEIDKEIDDFDFLFYISPYDVYPECLKVENRNIDQLIIHIPYSYYLVSKTDAVYAEPFYEKTIFNVAWLVCASNTAEIEIANELKRFRAYNFVMTGFPKMDEFIMGEYKRRANIWKGHNNIRIIWAPHFNMANGMNGTFKYNYMWFYDFAEKNNNISWVVRPHPRFASGAIEAGVFSDLKEVQTYFDKWNNLPNATVVDGGGYFDIFESSDAMIMDSISFIAEYQFTGKPILFLYPLLPRNMNKLGDELLRVLYKARGDDFEAIEGFIHEVQAGKDEMKMERDKIFDKRLNYYITNKKLATDCILERIMAIKDL
jgi:hypothetical protein